LGSSPGRGGLPPLTGRCASWAGGRGWTSRGRGFPWRGGLSFSPSPSPTATGAPFPRGLGRYGRRAPTPAPGFWAPTATETWPWSLRAFPASGWPWPGRGFPGRWGSRGCAWSWRVSAWGLWPFRAGRRGLFLGPMWTSPFPPLGGRPGRWGGWGRRGLPWPSRGTWRARCPGRRLGGAAWPSGRGGWTLRGRASRRLGGRSWGWGWPSSGPGWRFRGWRWTSWPGRREGRRPFLASPPVGRGRRCFWATGSPAWTFPWRAGWTSRRWPWSSRAPKGRAPCATGRGGFRGGLPWTLGAFSWTWRGRGPGCAWWAGIPPSPGGRRGRGVCWGRWTCKGPTGWTTGPAPRPSP
jgi:hypothetical protein